MATKVSLLFTLCWSVLLVSAARRPQRALQIEFPSGLVKAMTGTGHAIETVISTLKSHKTEMSEYDEIVNMLTPFIGGTASLAAPVLASVAQNNWFLQVPLFVARKLVRYLTYLMNVFKDLYWKSFYYFTDNAPMKSNAKQAKSKQTSNDNWFKW